MLNPNQPNPRNQMSTNYVFGVFSIVSFILIVIIMVLLSDRPSQLHFPGNKPVEKLQYIERHR